MPKLTSLLALASIAALLTGCTVTPSGRPQADPQPATSAASSPPSPSVTASATPSASASAAPSTEAAIPSASATPEPTSVASSEPAAPVGIIVTPEVEWGVATATVAQGSSFTITGSGYAPGQRISIALGIAQSDAFVFQDQSALADAVGNYSFTITLDPDLEPRTYAVVTSTPDGLEPGPAVSETRRWATIEVVAA
ncbi:MAG: hypothetical protein JWM61_1199 [Micrococcaceae bacterium]|nr:hypothetical protein [Micrococcaceae bacterium]